MTAVKPEKGVPRRKLTRKERVFVDRKADGATGVAAVLNNYDTTSYNVANAIASENLQKPIIIEALRELGFDSSNAKRVVANILNDERAKHADRLNAASKVFEVMGDYAPTKAFNVNIDVKADPKAKQLVDEFEKKLNETLDDNETRTVVA